MHEVDLDVEVDVSSAASNSVVSLSSGYISLGASHCGAISLPSRISSKPAARRTAGHHPLMCDECDTTFDAWSGPIVLDEAIPSPRSWIGSNNHLQVRAHTPLYGAEIEIETLSDPPALQCNAPPAVARQASQSPKSMKCAMRS